MDEQEQLRQIDAALIPIIAPIHVTKESIEEARNNVLKLLAAQRQADKTAVLQAINHISINPALSSHANVVQIQARLKSELGQPEPEDTDLCPICNCMTPTIIAEFEQTCGKCGADKTLGGDSQPKQPTGDNHE